MLSVNGRLLLKVLQSFINPGAIVRKLDNTIHRIVIFSTAVKRHKKVVTPGILNSQEMKSDFNSKMLNFSMGFTSHRRCFESFKKSLSGG